MSSCPGPFTPPNTYPRGLGIVLEEEEPTEDGPFIADDGIYPPGPTIVIQCDDEGYASYEGSAVTAPSDCSSRTLPLPKAYLSITLSGWEEEEDLETEQSVDIC